MQTTTPPKSRRRWYLFGGGLVMLFAVPFLFYLAAGWWWERQLAEITRAIEADDPHWRWPDLVAHIKAPPDEKNSTIQIRKIQDMLKAKPFDVGPKWNNATKQPLLHRNARLTQDELAQLRAAFAAIDPEALLEARKLKDMPQGHFAFQAEENPFTMKLDHVQELRPMMQLLQLDATLRQADEPDTDGAAESCLALLNAVRSIKDQPFLIAQLVRMAGQAITVATVEHLLGQREFSEEHLRKFQEALQIEIEDDGLYQAMRCERASGHQMYTLIRTGKTSISQLHGMTNVKVNVGDRLVDAFPGLLLNGYPEYLRMMNKQVEASKLRDVERMDAFNRIEQEVRDNRSNFLIRMIMPATVKVAEAAQHTQAGLRCAVVAVAAERYRIKHKNWPRGIEELVQAGLLKETPRDPYDGKPLRWKTALTGVMIYSIGIDKKDDGGVLDRDNPRAVGTDLGFELWNPRDRAVAAPAEVEAP